MVHKVALVACLGQGHVCTEDGVIKSGKIGGGAGGALLDGGEEVDCFGTALLIEDEDAGGGAGRSC